MPDFARERIYFWFTRIRHRRTVSHFVYIMASRPGGALYTGRAADLHARVKAHRAGRSLHTEKYNIKTLVWFEAHSEFRAALLRERQIKRWRRGWKIALITKFNPDWKDVTAQIPG